MMTINPTTDIIEFVFKTASIFITALGFFFGLYKFMIRSLDKKFNEHREMIKIEISGVMDQYKTRLEYVQEDTSKINCILSVLNAEQKTSCENIARLEASCLAMQRNCEKTHAWDGRERRHEKREVE